MKAKITVQTILCVILTVVTALMQSPAEVKAHTLCETCYAEKQGGGAYGYQYYYIVDLSGAVTEYVYNSKGLLVEETNPLGEVTVYTYDAFDRLLTTKTPDGTITSYEYTEDGKTTGITAKQANGETEELRYRYTPEGYLAAAISEATMDEYTYTEQGEVASVTRNGTYRLVKEQGVYGTIMYTYDVMGNRLSKTEKEVTTYYAYDLCNKLVSEKIGEAETIYMYDGMGNLVKKIAPEGETGYFYNAFSQLELVTIPTGDCQESFYDAFGIRSSLMENGVTTQYMTYNGIVLAAYNTNGERTEHYTYGNKILAWE